MTTAAEALARLREGNRRYVKDIAAAEPRRERRIELAAGQNPFAIVLGCSDSRVPAEIVFDQGLGDLFVIRVAGNIVAPSQVGSVEFAAERFGTRLVVVLGHSQCGAVEAALEDLRSPGGMRASRGVMSIVNRVRPAIAELASVDDGHDPAELMRHAVRANIRASVNQLLRGSDVIEQLIGSGLRVVGAEYCLASGVVDFFDGDPELLGA